METASLKASPGHPATDIPLHRNPPLAPSQELAYRNKCIQLKRRLNEIETNNDSTRKRIASERERVQKMRLLRAILLNQLQEVMTTSGKSLTTEQLSKLGITETEDPSPLRPEGETILDDSSDMSEDEEIPEPSERPTRMRRNNNYREPTKPLAAAASYAQTGLPNLAPANSASNTNSINNSTYSPSATRERERSEYQVTSTPLAAVSPAYSHVSHGQSYTDRYQHSSPIQQHQTIYESRHENGAPPPSAPVSAIPASAVTSANVAAAPPRPIHPDAPRIQFQSHMRPQLEADNYPADQIEARIDEEWRKLSEENRGLWEQRYQEQVVEYQQDLDAFYERQRRRDYR